MIRAVLDVNVLVSALLNPRGVPARIVKLWRADAFKAVACEALLAEFERVMLRPRLRNRAVAPAELKDLSRSIRRLSVMTSGAISVTDIARDQDDNKVLACALEGGADYIVTGDGDLLVLGKYEGIPIISPTAFLAVLGAVGPEKAP